MVFVTHEGKLSYRWYLWVFISEHTVYYILDPTRSTKVVKKYFGVIEEGILCVDRYSSCKSFAKDKENFILSFCRDHTRRDFIDVGRMIPKEEKRMSKRIECIGNIYHINNKRIMNAIGTSGFIEKDREPRDALDELKNNYETELKQKDLNIEQREAL